MVVSDAADYQHPLRPDALTAAPGVLSQHLRVLERRYRLGSHEIVDGEHVDVDPGDLAWWRLAYQCYLKSVRRF